MADETKGMDRLTKQLYYIPTIIGKLGVSIAEAQRMLNADYVHNISQILRLLGAVQGDLKTPPPPSGPNQPSPLAVGELLKQLAPPRYQFGETTLEFGADLSESLELAGGIGVGFGMAGVTVNASFSMGYARDYRAAAKITSVLQAFPADTVFGEKLLERAKEIEMSDLPLPSNAAVDKAVWDEVATFRKAVTGKDTVTAFKLTVEQPSYTLKKGAAATKVKIRIERDETFTEDVTLKCSGPAGVTVPSDAVLAANMSELEIDVAATEKASEGSTVVVVKGIAKGVLPEGCEINLTIEK